MKSKVKILTYKAYNYVKRGYIKDELLDVA